MLSSVDNNADISDKLMRLLQSSVDSNCWHWHWWYTQDCISKYKQLVTNNRVLYMQNKMKEEEEQLQQQQKRNWINLLNLGMIECLIV